MVDENDPLVAAMYTDKTQNWFDLVENQYLLIVNGDGLPVDRYKWQDGKHKNVYKKPVESQEMDKVKPCNVEQAFALDMLMDPTITVKMITGGFGTGKAQPDSTMIPTPCGFKKLGDIRPGDKVFDRHGKPTTVVNVYPQGIMDCYEVVFSDGRKARCNDQHLWSVITSKGNLKTITLREIMERGLRKNNRKLRFIIPACDPVEYSEEKFLVDPYVIGVFLGDGCCLDKPLTLSSSDEEIVSEVARLLGAVSYHKTSDKNYNWVFEAPSEWNKQYQKTTQRLKNFQTKDVLPSELIAPSGEKYIPQEYLLGSVEQRLSLLQGLLDTDGSISETKGCVRFSTTSHQLKDDVCNLVWSLGMRASVSEDRRKSKYSSGVCFHISITSIRSDKQSLFRLERKKKRAVELEMPQHYHRNRISIVDIKKLPEPEAMTCIYVDNDEHLYLTEQFLVTHNTFLAVCAAYQQMRMGLYDKIVWVRNNIEVKDTNSIGALPGTYVEKMSVWAMPLADHLGGRMQLDTQIMLGKVEIEHLGFLRGRDIKHAVIFCSEAEHLTREHVQLLLGRVSEGSVLILEGDTKQTDKAVFAKESGLIAAVNCLKGNRLFGYIHLKESVRSETAKLADLLDK